jgi:hypothetical protein
MRRDGQTARDYGMHTTPGAQFELYGPCGCGAQPGKPCLDRRIKHLPQQQMWTAHSERQYLGWPA